ncbi:MAG: hypothetical protein ACYCYP_13840 [Leptospirales bacterium]
MYYVAQSKEKVLIKAQRIGELASIFPPLNKLHPDTLWTWEESLRDFLLENSLCLSIETEHNEWIPEIIGRMCDGVRDLLRGETVPGIPSEILQELVSQIQDDVTRMLG